MKVYGIIGWKNSGKTGLMERLVAHFTAKGLTVSTVKHVHHDVDLDQPGKDTFRHRAAGARETVLAGAHRFALLAEHRGPEPALSDILSRLAPVDLVLVEGYKRDPHPKIEVFRPDTGHTPIQPTDPTTRAVASDAPLPGLSVPVLNLNDTDQVADFILRDLGLLPDAPFDTVIIVDWSASSSPSPARPSADAIWIGLARPAQSLTSYHRTRAEAEAHLSALLDAEAAQGHRVLLGFDFPMAYPAGFGLHLTGSADPRALWHWLAAHVTDGPANRNNRFALADQINASFHAPGPFWGRPASEPHPHLAPTKPASYAALGLSERRLVETRVPRAQPVWKLYTTGSVGSQALMGLPLVHRLAQRPGARVWPFDAPTGPLVLAEVYPSLLSRAVAADPAPIKDEAQVRLLSRALLTLSRQGRLAPLWQTPPEAAEEGWILGAGHASLLESALA